MPPSETYRVPVMTHPGEGTTKRLPWNEAACALVGFATPFTVTWMGNFPVAEWFLLVLAGWALVARILLRRWPAGVFQTRWFILILVCQVLSLAGYVIADLYRDSAQHDYIRGWARMTFLIVDLLGLAVLIGQSWRRWLALKIGLAFGVMVEAACFGPLFDNWWKFGVGLPITILVLALIGNRRGWVLVALVLLGGLHLFMDFRGLGGVCLILAAILGVPALSIRLRLPVIALAICLAAGSFLFYITNPDNGRRKDSDSERQAMIETAALAFADSPFIGQGSWFSTTHIIRQIEARRMMLEESFSGYGEEEADKLAIHSQLLVALAEGGILGGLYFLVLGLLLLWALFYATSAPGPQRPLVLLFLLEAIGNLCISPFSGPARVHIAAATVLVLLLWLQSRGRLHAEGGRA